MLDVDVLVVGGGSAGRGRPQARGTAMGLPFLAGRDEALAGDAGEAHVKPWTMTDVWHGAWINMIDWEHWTSLI